MTWNGSPGKWKGERAGASIWWRKSVPYTLPTIIVWKFFRPACLIFGMLLWQLCLPLCLNFLPWEVCWPRLRLMCILNSYPSHWRLLGRPLSTCNLPASQQRTGSLPRHGYQHQCGWAYIPWEQALSGSFFYSLLQKASKALEEKCIIEEVS